MTVITALALSYALGIAICGIIKSFLIPYCLTVLLIFIALFLFKANRGFEIILLLIALSLGCLSFKNNQTFSPWHISRYKHLENKACLLKGIVIEKGLVRNNRHYVVLNSQQLQSHPFNIGCTGKVFLILKDEPGVSLDQTIIARGKIGFIKTNAKNKYANYLSNKGIHAIMNIEKQYLLAVLEDKKPLSIKGLALKLKERLTALFAQNFSPSSSSVLCAMILGEKKGVPARIENCMVKTGTIHILVVSGFNVGLIALIIISLLKILHIKKQGRFYITIPLIIFYCLLTGASTPVLRATIMAIVFLFAAFLKREANLQNSLFLSMLIILINSPSQLYDVGFQLSFLSVASIFYFYPKINAKIKKTHLNKNRLRYLANPLQVSLSAWLGTFPLIAYYFRIFSPVTLLANILIVPLASLVIFFGLSYLLIKLTVPALSYWFKISTEYLIFALLKLNQLISQLPGGYFYLK